MPIVCSLAEQLAAARVDVRRVADAIHHLAEPAVEPPPQRLSAQPGHPAASHDPAAPVPGHDRFGHRPIMPRRGGVTQRFPTGRVPVTYPI